MAFQVVTLKSVPLHCVVSCVTYFFLDFVMVNFPTFLNRHGDELGFGVHVDTLLESFLIDEDQFAQLQSDAYCAGQTAESFDI